MQLDQLLTSYYVACDGRGVAFLRDGLMLHVQPNDRLVFYKINDPASVRNIMIFHRKNAILSPQALSLIHI